MNTQPPNQLSERKPDQSSLFALPEADAAESAVARRPGGRPRVQRANRRQVAMRTLSLDALLPEGHQARLVWEYVDALDLTPLYQQIRAVEGRAGRDPIDPKILMGLWLYATLQGVGAARQLDRLCRDHVAYQWICGGVSMNYHTLSDFRTAHTEFLGELLTQSVATLMHQDLVTLNRVAQDGMRVRANAGAGSFRRRKTLEQCQGVAQEQVEALHKELEGDPAGATKREQAARNRGARQRSERIQRALRELSEVESKKKAAEKDKARASTTDPEARVMKMPDGGFRPAHNVQFATDTESQVITGVDVGNTGSDKGQLAPMVEQHKQRYGRAPDEMLADGDFAKIDDIEKVSSPQTGTVVYSPVPKPRKQGRDPHAARPGDSEAVIEWRRRMATAEAKEIYKERASTAECVNAIARNRGLRQFLVRGLEKVRAIALWFALAHNLMRAVVLRAQATLAMG